MNPYKSGKNHGTGPDQRDEFWDLIYHLRLSPEIEPNFDTSFDQAVRDLLSYVLKDQKGVTHEAKYIVDTVKEQLSGEASQHDFCESIRALPGTGG